MIYALGSVLIDQVLYIDHLPHTQEDVSIQHVSYEAGGCAYNVAQAIQKCTLIAPIGQGEYAQKLQALLPSISFDWQMHPMEGEHGFCLCLVEKDGERTFLAHHGVECVFHSDWLASIQKEDWVYLCGIDFEDSTNDAVLEKLQAIGCSIFFAPGPRASQIKNMERFYSMHPIVHVNRIECDTLGGMETIYAQTKQPVIMTDGSKGSYVYDGQLHFRKSKPLRPLNTIGAGDTHAGHMLLALTQGKDVSTCLDIANQKTYEYLKEKELHP